MSSGGVEFAENQWRTLRDGYYSILNKGPVETSETLIGICCFDLVPRNVAK